MNKIDWLQQNNPAGLMQVQFAPAYLIYQGGQGMLLGSLELSDVNPWTKIYLSVSTGGFTEVEEVTDNGSVFQVQVSGFYPGDSADTRAIFSAMQLHKWIVKATDSTGLVHTAGTITELMDFQANFQVDVDMAGSRGWQLQWSGVFSSRTPAGAS